MVGCSVLTVCSSHHSSQTAACPHSGTRTQAVKDLGPKKGPNGAADAPGAPQGLCQYSPSSPGLGNLQESLYEGY